MAPMSRPDRLLPCLAALGLSAPAAAAWEFSADPICTLRHDTGAARIEITYDPAGPLYTLTLTRAADAWAESPTFGMAFTGGPDLRIGTSRHQISGQALIVQDTGFGNVLDGLEFNTEALAFTDTQSVSLPLNDAAPAVRQFRDCPATPLS